MVGQTISVERHSGISPTDCRMSNIAFLIVALFAAVSGGPIAYNCAKHYNGTIPGAFGIPAPYPIPNDLGDCICSLMLGDCEGNWNTLKKCRDFKEVCTHDCSITCRPANETKGTTGPIVTIPIAADSACFNTTTKRQGKCYPTFDTKDDNGLPVFPCI